ncbi:MAG: tetratricopeptide repeat protein [Saprospiraceae bacterium]
MKNIRLIIAVILSIYFPFQFYAQPDILLKKAEKEYENKNYHNSVELYESLIDSGYVSSELYYNLGNSYFMSGDYPHARLYYEKAKKINPNNPDINKNLDLTQKKLDTDLEELPIFIFVKWWQNYVAFFNVKIWFYFVILSLIILLFVIVYIIFINRNIGKKVKNIVLVFLSLIVIMNLLAFFTSEYNYSKEEYILLNNDNIFNGPDSRSEKLYNLKAGEKILLIDSLQNWYFVELINNEKGWINKENLNKI